MRRPTVLTFLFVVVATSSFAAPPKRVDQKLLEDFKKCAKRKGCAAIPYKEHRRDCEVRSMWQNEACGLYGCEELKVVRQVVADIDELTDNIREHTDKGRAENDYIREQRKRREALLERLKDYQEPSLERMRTGERCVGARESIAELFKEMKKKVEKEPDHGDRAMKSYKHDIVEHFEDETPNHLNQIRDVRNAVENCREVGELRVKK
jgi:hypothetical protein